MPSRTEQLLLVGTLSLAVGLAALSYAFQDRLNTALASLTKPSKQETIENLRAFAKLYGYVRYFHPSDAAANIDWDKFAIHGVRQVKDASSQAELKAELETLFEPIAPTVKLYPTSEDSPPPADMLTPPDTAGLDPVAWQHRGVSLGNPIVLPFRSTRINRPSNLISETRSSDRHTKGPSVQILQILDASPYSGQQVKMRAAVKTDGEGTYAYLWLFPYRVGQILSEGMFDQPITSQSWSIQERTQHVSPARGLIIGGFVKGEGTAWFDDFELFTRDSRQDEWAPVELNNPGFESEHTGERPLGWTVGEGVSSYVSATTETASEGRHSLRLRSPLPSQVSLFPERPNAGEVINKQLGRGLSVQLPLALYSEGDQTLRPHDAPSPTSLYAELDSIQIDTLTAKEEVLRLTDVTIAWNVFQHFYPYFDVVDVDWDQVLSRTLRRTLDDESKVEFLRTLRRMIAQLDDGHGRVSHSGEFSRTGLPVRFARIENEVVVVDTAKYVEGDLCVEPGDVVVSTEGRSTEQELREAKQYISGSPQWKEVRALQQFGLGDPGSTASLTLRREETEIECQIPRAAPYDERTRQRQLRRGRRADSIETLREGIGYVDLTRAEWPDLRKHLDDLAQAEGVVFDLRGYPTGDARKILNHLSTDTLRSARFQIPQHIYPDQELQVGYDTSGRWTLPPKKPQITGDVAFLTNARAISYSESIMGIVEHYQLGEIVGQPTAGTNGTINPFELPGGYRVWWTGMRVRKHDGSQHHLIGIRPTVPVERTIEGVRKGRDEYLEKALEVLQEKKTSETKPWSP